MVRSIAHVKFLERLQIFSLFTFVVTSTFSIAGAHLSLGLLAIVILLRSWRERRWLLSKTGFEWPIVAFLVACLLSSLFSEVPLTSLKHLKHLLLISAVFLMGASLRDWPDLRWPLVWTFMGSASAAALYGLGKFALGFSSKVQSTQSTTMTWGALSVMFMAVTLQIALASPTRHHRWLARMLFIPQIFAMLLSFVRGAYVGFAASVIYLLRQYWSKRRLLVQRVLPVLAAVILVSVMLSPDAVRQRVTAIFNLNTPTTLVRLVQWKYALQIAADYPVFGVGWRDMLPVFRRYAAPYVSPDAALADHVNHDIFSIGHFHSMYVMVLVCFGVVGLVAFVWLLAAVWRQLAAAIKRAATEEDRIIISASRAAMVGFLVAGIFDWTFGDAEVVTMFWMVVGLGMTTPAQGSAPASTTTAL